MKFRVGDFVKHKIYGVGKVRIIEGEDIGVEFENEQPSIMHDLDGILNEDKGWFCKPYELELFWCDDLWNASTGKEIVKEFERICDEYIKANEDKYKDDTKEVLCSDVSISEEFKKVVNGSNRTYKGKDLPDYVAPCVTKIIVNKNAVIVFTKDKEKAVAKCDPEDTFDLKTGYEICYRRILLKRLRKEQQKIQHELDKLTR